MKRLDIWQADRTKATQEGPLLILRDQSETAAYVKVWTRKATKPYANYRFKSVELREEYIAQQLSHHNAHAEMVAKRKADRIPGPDIITKADPGAIFYNSWGYDQTNIDWYQVVSRSGVMVTIRPIGCEISSDKGHAAMSGKTVPCKDKFVGLEKRKKIYASGADLYLPMAHGSCSLWDGRPKYCSWYA